MTSKVQRSAITTAFFTVLTGSGKQVGLGVAPRGNVGWVGQPNADGTNFIPYSVLTALPAAMGTGSFSEPNEDIWFPYAITSYGVSHSQAEDMADVLRQAAQSIRKLTVTQFVGSDDEYGRRIQAVVVQAYGGVQPIGDTDPRTYGVTDTVSLWTTG